eukprot:TRINITY_DN26888_c0_g1_i11.p1 TRINITY_DN26888_c0_g1~~TRINITY_DN26888_c0_g1_i11.p1  ORF type:complete len:196 (-),score=16.62 TRINITY_DN26888_c0_g1_i11:76-588(-)
MFSDLLFDLRRAPKRKSKKSLRLETEDLKHRLQESLQREKQSIQQIQQKDDEIQILKQQILQMETGIFEARVAYSQSEKVVQVQKSKLSKQGERIHKLEREYDQAISRAVLMEKRLERFKKEVREMLKKIMSKTSRVQGMFESASSSLFSSSSGNTSNTTSSKRLNKVRF